MSDKFSGKVLAQGFNPSKGKFWGKLIWFAIMFSIFAGIFYKTFIVKTIDEQKNVAVKNAGTVIIEAEKKKRSFFCGIEWGRLGLGVTLEKKERKQSDIKVEGDK